MEQRDGLTGQAAVVTGASSGLGRATAKALAEAGASVGLLARGEEELVSLADEIAADGGRATPLPCDLADANGLTQVMRSLRQQLGPVRVLVNAAATDAPQPVAEMSVDAWDRVMAVNLRAVFVLSKLAVADMVATGQGTVVNVSSVAGKRGWANASAYCASKFALTGFTQALGAEVRPHGVRACIVYPGAMATHWGQWSPAERSQKHSPEAPEKQAHEALPPEHVARFITWLATAPPELVLDEVVVTPLEEQGYP